MKNMIFVVCLFIGVGCARQEHEQIEVRLISNEEGNYMIISGKSDAELFEEALRYRKGYGREMDIAQAYYIEQKLADRGFLPAQTQLYDMYNLPANPDLIGDENIQIKYHEDMLKLYRENKLKPREMYEVGVFFKFHGKEDDDIKSYEWIKKAAEAGYVTAQYRLAKYYAIGMGVSENINESFRLLKKAAIAGHIEAQYDLSKFFKEGLGTERDLEQSVYWLKKSASGGFADAELELGKEIARKDKKDQDAIQWFMKAAQKGNAEALFILAGYYIGGEIVKEDRQLAFKLLLRSARNGYIGAQRSAGDLYLAGFTGVKDQKNAIYWYQKAAEQGDEHSKAKLDELIPQQKPEAKKNN